MNCSIKMVCRSANGIQVLWRFQIQAKIFFAKAEFVRLQANFSLFDSYPFSAFDIMPRCYNCCVNEEFIFAYFVFNIQLLYELYIPHTTYFHLNPAPNSFIKAKNMPIFDITYCSEVIFWKLQLVIQNQLCSI